MTSKSHTVHLCVISPLQPILSSRDEQSYQIDDSEDDVFNMDDSGHSEQPLPKSRGKPIGKAKAPVKAKAKAKTPTKAKVSLSYDDCANAVSAAVLICCHTAR